MKTRDLTQFIGKTMESVEKIDDDAIKFVTTDGERYTMQHLQDCCEDVVIEDIEGDLAWLVGSPIVSAYESSSDDPPPHGRGSESHTWTFYHIATAKGAVTLRWFGESNGYYSEDVGIYKEDR